MKNRSLFKVWKGPFVSNHKKLFTTCNLQFAVSKLARLAVPNVFALEYMAGAYPRGQV